MSDAIAALREQAVTAIQSAVSGLDRCADLFDEAAAQLERATGASSAGTPTGTALGVIEQWLDTALAAAPPETAALAVALRAAAHRLVWKQAYEELESTPELEAYRQHYAWAPLAMPAAAELSAPYDGGDLLVGFTIQAPGVLYPHHHHHAAELYGVISGTIDWQVGPSSWMPKVPGDVIVHRPSESHAMRTGSVPGLCWVVWPSDTDSAVYMPSLDPSAAKAPTLYSD